MPDVLHEAAGTVKSEAVRDVTHQTGHAAAMVLRRFRRKAWASNVAALLHSPCTATQRKPSLACLGLTRSKRGRRALKHRRSSARRSERNAVLVMSTILCRVAHLRPGSSDGTIHAASRLLSCDYLDLGKS